MLRSKIFVWLAFLWVVAWQSTRAQEFVKYSLPTLGDFETTIVRGGSFAKSGVNNSDDTQDPKRWTMKSTGAYIQCTCAQAIAEGDELVLTGTPKSTSTSGFSIRLEGTKTATTIASLKSSGKMKEQATHYTVEAGSGLIGQTTFYVMIEDNKRLWWINSIEVKTSHPIVPSISISTAMQYSTYSNTSYDVDFSNSGAKAYIITGRNGEQLVFKEVTRIPYNTGVLVVAPKGSTVSPTATLEATDDVIGNLLVADDGSQTANENTYILTIVDGEPGFYKSSTSRVLKSGKAHLQLIDENQAKGFSLGVDQLGQTTGIAVSSGQVHTVASYQYNLVGQRVGDHYHGVVVKNGKKIIRR